MFLPFLVTFLLSGSTQVTGFPLQKRDFPDPEPCLGNCSWIHDPSLIVKNGTYYRFSTSGNVAIATAPSISGPWEYQGCMLPDGPKTEIDYDGPNAIDVWAPDVHRIGDQYWTFYAVSTIGFKDSEIGVASSYTLDPGTWKDHGSLRIPHGDYNLIDPNLFITPDKEFSFIFGSYWSGIQRVDLTDPHVAMENIVKNATASPAVVEGAFQFETTVQGKSWFYVFFSSGQCCNVPPNLAPPGQEYKVMVCRGEDVAGPFYDQNGLDCLDSGGTLVLGSHGDVYAPGGQGVMDILGRPVMYYHYVKPSVGYDATQFFFGFNYLDFSSGWPVVVSE